MTLNLATSPLSSDIDCFPSPDGRLRIGHVDVRRRLAGHHGACRRGSRGGGLLSNAPVCSFYDMPNSRIPKIKLGIQELFFGFPGCALERDVTTASFANDKIMPEFPLANAVCRLESAICNADPTELSTF